MGRKEKGEGRRRKTGGGSERRKKYDEERKAVRVGGEEGRMCGVNRRM